MRPRSSIHKRVFPRAMRRQGRRRRRGYLHEPLGRCDSSMRIIENMRQSVPSVLPPSSEEIDDMVVNSPDADAQPEDTGSPAAPIEIVALESPEAGAAASSVVFQESPATDISDELEIQESDNEDGGNIWQASVAEHASSWIGSDNNSERNAEEGQPTIEPRVLQRLLRGKTMEALSFVIGSRGLEVIQYGWMRETMNSYCIQVGDPCYPAYKNLLYNSMRILKNCVYVRHCTVETTVDTSRAGVQQRYVKQQRSGTDPKLDITFVRPSDWASKDIILYDYMNVSISQHRKHPRITYIDTSILLNSLICRSLSTYLFEVQRDSGGYSMGMLINEGEKIQLSLVGQLAAAVFSGDGNVQTVGDGRLSQTKIELIIGTTSFAAVDDPENCVSTCDAVTVLNDPDGKRWRDAVIVHKFASPPGARSSFVRVIAGNGEKTTFRWSALSLLEGMRAGSDTEECKSFGMLSNGRRYAIMRCLLYTDDFKPYGFRQSSAGGCYLLPLSIAPWDRSGIHSIRIVGVTPAGVTSNHIVRAVTEDIAKSASVGIPVEMPDDTVVQLFVDIVGYVGDYQAMVHLLDVTGVNGVAPCNFCTFRRANTGTHGDDGSTVCELSSYGYSTSIHSANLSFRRSKERMTMWRSIADDDEMQRVGLRDLTEGEVNELPLHYLSNALDEVRQNVPLTSEGKPVVPCVFDPYLSCLAAPDHLLIGVAQDIVHATLLVLSPAQRNRVNTLATHALANAGYGAESALLASGSYKTHKMSFSSFSNFMLVIPWAVRVSLGMQPLKCESTSERASGWNVRDDIIRALFLFQQLRLKTFYIPVVPVDGAEEVASMDEKTGSVYIQQLQGQCVQYISLVNELCGKNARFRREVDKPNLHRLLELYFHSIPRVGHASLFRELILESGHQPLKKGFNKSNNHEPHAYAMSQVLADDWKHRLGVVCLSIRDISNLTVEDCKRLMQVAFGLSDFPESERISYDDVRRSFPSHVLRKYRTMASSPSARRKLLYWFGSTATQSEHCTSEQERVCNFLQLIIPRPDLSENAVRVVRFKCGVWANGKVVDGEIRRAKSGKLAKEKCIERGSVLQILLQAPLHLNYSLDTVQMLIPSSSSGSRTFWYVRDLYSTSKGHPLYAHLHRMEKVHDTEQFEQQYRVKSEDTLQFVVRLTENMRICLALHDCTKTGDTGCMADDDTHAFEHAADTSLDVWTIMGTKEGFPPKGS